MNREHMGKALHAYLSASTLVSVIKNGGFTKDWGRIREETKEECRTIGEGLSQDFLYGGKYELSLSHIDADQILYNGLFTCTFTHHNGSCHVLVLSTTAPLRERMW